MPQPRKRKADNPGSAPHAKIGNLLDLEDSPRNHDQPLRQIPDDDKVVNALNKLRLKTPILGDSSVYLKIIVSITEASYFATIIELITNLFKLTDLVISKPVEGSVDRFITLYGSVESVCKSAVYISYCLAAKLNNFLSSNSFTLKSNNYYLSFFERPRSIESKSWATIGASLGTRVFDYSDSYCHCNDLSTIYLRGDFHSIFDSLSTIIQHRDTKEGSYYIEDERIHQVLVTGNYGNPLLFQRQDVNVSVLAKLTEEVLLFLKSQTAQ